jgi:nicotinamide phosphoribosyltransferase
MIPALNLTDFYKTDHRRQFPEGTTSIYSNFTARGSRIRGLDSIVFFGLQYFVQEYLIERFQQTLFGVPKQEAVRAYQRRLDCALGPGAVPMDHVEALHDLGYLPLRIKALPEGSLVPIQVPCLTVENTDPRFPWLTNFIETMLSATLWGACTSATIAREYRRVFEHYARVTGAPLDFVAWQGHDFSFRGMFGIEAACLSGAGHLLSFSGTDTIPAIDFLERYYGADAQRELIGGSVPATEHAVMCAGGQGSEIETYRRLMTEVYPRGIVSIVSDTWDFWRVVRELLPALKSTILAREGKVVVRPDSGNPVDILCGDPKAEQGTLESKGLVEALYDLFGGTRSSTGHRLLDPHVGAIYGDSITLERQAQILAGLERKGFASSNVVFGIGSFTYQYNTRDTFGFAMKATQCEVEGAGRDIFKSPKTDAAKASHRGLICVSEENGKLRAIFPAPRELEESERNLLRTVFEDGKIVRPTTLAEMRARVTASLRATETS